MSTPEQSYDSDSPRKGALGLALGALLLIGAIIASIFAFVSGHEAEDEATASPSASAPITPSCGGETDEQEMPGADFAAYPKALSPSVRIAYLDGIGPCNMDSIPTGYAHSPAGALLAGANYVTLMSVQGPMMEQAIATLTQPGDFTDAMIQTVREQALPEVSQATIRGFILTRITADEYKVALAVEFPGASTPVSWTVTMDWVDGNWLAEPTVPSQGWSIASMRGVTIDGYTTWGF